MNSRKSIVVLPFENISSDPENEYFADGVTEEIINALSRIEGLKVTARTSSFAYKNKPKDIRIIGNELGVSAALEGSIRKSGNRIRITAQLIQTDNGFHLWSETFDRDLTDIFEVQDEISLLIADKIRENFGHLEISEHLVTAWTSNVEAYSLFLKGRFYQLRWNVEDFHKATVEYEKSIKLDPGFFQPYFGLVQCYSLMGAWGFMDKSIALDKTRYYLNEGIKINDQTSEAHFAMATKSLWVEWKPYEALGHLDKALAINSNDSESLECAAECLIPLGKFEEATQYIKRALEVNPLSANHHFTLGNIHYLQEEYSEALECFERSLKIDPTWDFSLQVSACCYVFLGKKDDLNHLIETHPEMKDAYLFGYLYDAIQHQKSIKLEELKELNDVYFPWPMWALIYAGKTEEALELLRAGIASKQGQYLNFQREPLNNPLKSTAEYNELIKFVFDQPNHSKKEARTFSPNELIPKEEQAGYKQKLDKLMQGEELYLSEDLTLRSLAEKIELNANKLSWLLNQVIGKNFNEYINGLRIEAFKEKALDPAFGQYSLLGIAFECGFKSKSVFNDFFKRTEGMTPKAWVKMNTE